MATVVFNSTAAGVGFDMRDDWRAITTGAKTNNHYQYEQLSAVRTKFGLSADDFGLLTHTAGVWDPANNKYNILEATWHSFSATHDGAEIFSVTGINQTGQVVDDFVTSYLDNLTGGPSTANLSQAVYFALLQDADAISGSQYADYIKSYAGRDTVNSGGGADRVYGGTSGDKLNGSSGDDRLYGETGNDTLTGGIGLDTFVFSTKLNASSNVDEITDFNVADDEIWLDNDVFTTAGAVGQLDSDAFYKGSSAADAQDRLIYNSSTGALYYDRDGTGTTYAKVLIAELDVGLALTYKDFDVIG